MNRENREDSPQRQLPIELQ